VVRDAALDDSATTTLDAAPDVGAPVGGGDCDLADPIKAYFYALDYATQWPNVVLRCGGSRPACPATQCCYKGADVPGPNDYGCLDLIP